MKREDLFLNFPKQSTVTSLSALCLRSVVLHHMFAGLSYIWLDRGSSQKCMWLFIQLAMTNISLLIIHLQRITTKVKVRSVECLSRVFNLCFSAHFHCFALLFLHFIFCTSVILWLMVHEQQSTVFFMLLPSDLHLSLHGLSLYRLDTDDPLRFLTGFNIC